ncbi:MAG: outer membrane protein beta-barrel protein [Mucilaginibacter sp.]|nr:outer membrane protein beta-barrel protein [Mucilaginibacter sp.]
MPKFVAIIFLLFISYHLQAQTWEIGGAIGGAGYQGDLNLNNPVKLSGLSGSIFAKRNFNGYLSAKLNYTMGKISADDSKSSSEQFRDRNLSFSDNLKEISLIGEFNFMKYIPDAGPNKYTPYIYSGIGYTAYNPRANYQGQTYSLRDLRTEGEPIPYGKRTMVIPYGAGLKYNFNSKWTVAGDIGYRFTFTDYLDDVSTVYPDPTKLPSNLARDLSDRSSEVGKPVNSPGSQRGDFKKRDTYFFIGFTISYTFVTQSCYY